MCVALALGFLAPPATAQSWKTLREGEPVIALIEAMRADGITVAYSPVLVGGDLSITTWPVPGSAVKVLTQVLAAHGLGLEMVEGLHVVVRRTKTRADVIKPTSSLLIAPVSADSNSSIADLTVRLLGASDTPQWMVGDYFRIAGLRGGEHIVQVSAPGYVSQTVKVDVKLGATKLVRVSLIRSPANMPEIVVAASRYEFLRDRAELSSLIGQHEIQSLADVGDDPMRAVRRLPGTAAATNSAKTFVRGSESDDMGIFLNGQRLLDPFHVRDYQSLFSSIDVRAVDGVEVYTGGFPVRYGDNVGGLVLVDTLTPDATPRTELGLSVFNTSFLSSGTIADGDAQWLLSARRGNLDLIIDERFGRPFYSDLFAEIGVHFSPDSFVSANALVGNDRILIVTEADPDELEQSRNDVDNRQFWINWRQTWRKGLQSNTTFSVSSLNSDRNGLVNDPEKIVGTVDDRRKIDLFGVRQDWTLSYRERQEFSAGFELEHREAQYDYRSQVTYSGGFLFLPNINASRSNDIDILVNGDYVSFYFADTIRLNKRTVGEVGFRWDKQTYTDVANERQFSPRLSLVHALTPQTDLRLSWGRFFQSQGVHELQVEDGVSQFFPARRADHAILGLHHRLTPHYSLRIEAYRKSMGQLRPRFENLYDPLSVIPELEPDRVRVAPDRARAQGIELSLAYDGPRDLSWWATYTRSRADDVIDGETFARSWDQRDALSFGMAYSSDRLDLSLGANYHSGWPRNSLRLIADSGSGQSELVANRRNSARYQSFMSLDLRAAYRWTLPKGDLNVFVELSNATNRENQCCTEVEVDLDPSGRPILELENDFWLPILPAIGVLWEF